MKKVLILVLGLLIATTALAANDKYITKVGEEVMTFRETPHPITATERAGEVWQDVFRYPGATYIAVHFARFDLERGEKVVISTPDGKYAYGFQGMGKDPSGNFWATHVPGDTAVVTYYHNGDKPGWGYVVDKYAHGYPAPVKWPPVDPAATEGICGADNTLNAICYQSSEPDIYNNSKAVARLLSSGSALCTAWLVGCGGHVMTNNHCISDQSGVNSADWEFMAEGATCAADCTTSPYCPGSIWMSGTPGTFVTTNYNADYTLIKLPVNGSSQKPSDLYGFLKLRTTPPVIGERIYLPGHPAGWGKRIAVTSDNAADPTGFPQVQTLDYAQCQGTGGPLDISYYADTQGGSSGSPVLGYSDHRVASIHHCNAGSGACPNRGVPMNVIVTDLQTQGLLPPCATQQFAGTVKFDTNAYICNDIASITVLDDNLIGQTSQTVTVVSTTEGTPETVTLVPLPAPNDNTFVGSIPLVPPPAVASDGNLSVSDGDTITVTYIDADDGQGGVNITRTATALIDCTSPVITNVNATNVTGQGARINWLTNEPATSIVTYGSTTPPGTTRSGGALVATHAFDLTGLNECSKYYYQVSSQDDAGNSATDNNGGSYYTFQTGKNVNPSYTSTDTPVAIPDNNATGASSTIAVIDPNTVTDVNVKVNITHTFDGDLSIYLIGPNNTSVLLSNRRGSSGANFTNTVFDDQATTAIASGTAPFTGSYIPDNPLSVFNGLIATGNWTLKVVDGAAADVGTITDWTLQLTYPAEPCGAGLSTDAAIYSCSSVVTITVKDGNVVGSTVTVTAVSNTEVTPETVTLTRQAAPRDTWFQGTLPLTLPPAIAGNGQLSVVNGDTITITYIDADDGQGNTNVTVTTTATTQCAPPVISNVSATGVTGGSADINWLTNVPATSIVHYGLSTPPGSTSSSAALVTTHLKPLTGLSECSQYYYSVESADIANNAAIDNNGGSYYTFHTSKSTNPTYTYPGPSLPIPDNNTTGVLTTVTVTDHSLVSDINVRVNATHTYDGDVKLSLISPAGTEVLLSNQRGSSGDNFTNTVFDDQATTPIASGTAPFTGSFIPDQPLSTFNGTLAAGVWTLRAADVASALTGSIDSWSITLTYPPEPCGAKLWVGAPVYGCSSLVTIGVQDPNAIGSTIPVTVVSGTETSPEAVTLTRLASPYDTWFQGTIQLTSAPPVSGNGLLSVVNGDTITVTYIDADDGQGNTNVLVTTTATTQCTPPVITNVSSSNVLGTTAQINWLTNVPAGSVVHYGTTVPPTSTASTAPLVTGHALGLTGLTPCATYYFSVESADAYGNTAIDNNGGNYYVFVTAQNTAHTYASTDTPLAIPDGDTTNGVTSTINVTDPDPIQDLNVLVNVQHTWVGDVTLTLIAPNGTNVSLVARRGSSGDNMTNTLLDDQATTSISAGTPPFTGSFKPETPLSAINGISAAGAWKLKATDSVTTDTGTLLNWSLQFSYQPRVCGPSAAFDSKTVTDSCPSGGPGNGNGIVERGEDITMPVTIRNNGAVTLTGISATLTTTTPDITIFRGSATFPDMATSSTSTSNAPHFGFSVGPTVPCGTDIAFNLVIHTAQGNFNGSFTVKVGAEGTATTTYTSTDVPKPVPDSNTTGNTSALTVTDTHTVSKVTVKMSMTHTYDGDLNISLIAPNGTSVPLSSRRGSSGDNFTNTVFDDAATTSISAGTAPFTGSYKPETPLSAVAGIPANGTWTLKVVDAASGDTGTITAFSIDLTTAVGWVCIDCVPAIPTGEPIQQFWVGKTAQQWEAIAGATSYHMYRGVAADLPKLLTAVPESCARLTTTTTSTGPVLTESPATGGLYWYLVRAANIAGEGPAGSANPGGPRNQGSTGACP